MHGFGRVVYGSYGSLTFRFPLFFPHFFAAHSPSIFYDSSTPFSCSSLVNGDRFEGNYANGLREGSGVHYYLEKNKKFVGEWLEVCDFLDPRCPFSYCWRG